MFSCKHGEIFKNTYFEEHLRTTACVYNNFHFLVALIINDLNMKLLSLRAKGPCTAPSAEHLLHNMTHKFKTRLYVNKINREN